MTPQHANARSSFLCKWLSALFGHSVCPQNAKILRRASLTGSTGLPLERPATVAAPQRLRAGLCVLGRGTETLKKARGFDLFWK